MLGTSAGGYGAMSLAIRHRETIGAVATLAAPLNLRYANVDGDYFEDFDPATYRWMTRYDPDEVIGVYLSRPPEGPGASVHQPRLRRGRCGLDEIIRTNPADLLFSTDLRPGELAMYVHYPGRGEWNFDAQDQSFAWLAAQRGIAVTLVERSGRAPRSAILPRQPPLCLPLAGPESPAADALTRPNLASHRWPG